jgi:xanthine dehydrogenase YagR molybdenum-binding subunit
LPQVSDDRLPGSRFPPLPGWVKGIGMLGTAGIQAAIANAVYDAIGKRVRKLPIRIEDCL